MAAGGPAPPGLLRHRCRPSASSKYVGNMVHAGGWCHRTSEDPVVEHSPAIRGPLLWKTMLFGARTITRSTCPSTGRVHVLRRQSPELVRNPTFSDAPAIRSAPLYGTFVPVHPGVGISGATARRWTTSAASSTCWRSSTVLMVIGLVRCLRSSIALAPPRNARRRFDLTDVGRAALAHRAASLLGMISVLDSPMTCGAGSSPIPVHRLPRRPAPVHAGLERLEGLRGTPRTVAQGLARGAYSALVITSPPKSCQGRMTGPGAGDLPRSVTGATTARARTRRRRR